MDDSTYYNLALGWAGGSSMAGTVTAVPLGLNTEKRNYNL